MIKTNTLQKFLIIVGLMLLITSGLAACQGKAESTPAGDDSPVSQPEHPAQGGDQGETGDVIQASPESNSSGEPAAPTSPAADAEPDLEAIQAAWQSSPHANTFVEDAAGQNNSCAQCHAPFDWLPSMETLPESCFACKFELEDPPSYIPEDAWAHIPCTICHPVDRDDNILPEIAWLEIPILGEYAEVASATELCLKCHAPNEIPGHGRIELVSAHADYQCTGCHAAHTTATYCASEACHSDVINPETPIPGHDEDHQVVSCVACHDGSGMEVGPDEESGMWTTFTTSASAETELVDFAFTSHNIVLESSCERCHFADNPWALSAEVAVP
jgi:hypothetical protein